jgi:RNA polymerase sigma-70 factor (ECF subfamily)
VVLVDVLGHSGEEAREALDTTLPALKAALNRGRARLRELSAPAATTQAVAPGDLIRLQAYADRFNARDFDALRALLAEDVRLDLVNRTTMAGKAQVANYFHRYAEIPTHWRMAVGLAEGRPALLVSYPEKAPEVEYVVLLDWQGDRITAIRDFVFARYVTESLALT